ncbi:MAG: hypothetical protein ABR521_09275 [Gaiellaceae bacterium]
MIATSKGGEEHMRRTLAVAVALAAGALAVAGQTRAATWTIHADRPGKPPAGAPTTLLNQFFPRRLEIHAGDEVRFFSKEFHTATFLGKAKPARLPFLFPDPGNSELTGITDSTGETFWFDGLVKLIYNAQLTRPSGSTTVSGTAVHNSGILLFHKRGYSFDVPKPGVYRYFCAVHPTMSGTIVARRKSARIPSKDAVQVKVAERLRKSWAEAGRLAKQVPPLARTVYAGLGKDVAVLTFQPKKLTIPVGESVTWVNRSPSERHNMAFGLEKYVLSLRKETDLLPVVPQAPNQVSPFITHGSEQPGQYVHDGTNHGNGFLATPAIDDVPGNPPRGLVGRFSIRFTAAGSFKYLCMIHGKGMRGEIVVTE